jgi:prefoldin alpha subunit
MGGGTFLNGIIKDVSNVLVDIGAGYVTEKNLADAIKKIDQRIVSLQENQERLFSLIQKLQSEANELSQKTQALIDQSQQ